MGFFRSRMRLLSMALFAVIAVALLFAFGSAPEGARAQQQQPPPRPVYKCFTLQQQGPPVGANVTVTGVDFGEQNVGVLAAHYLCPPAIKNQGPPPVGEPHLKCYDVTGRNPGLIVDLKTQFGPEKDVKVRQPKLLCVPALQADPPAVPVPPAPSEPVYLCFDIVGNNVNARVKLETKFGTETDVKVDKATRLCLAGIKDGQGSLGSQPLKCYTIAGSDPNQKVNLLTKQFGDEPNVLVRNAELLCVPVDVSNVRPQDIGGIAELPEEAVAPLEAVDSSGTNAGILAGVAGAIAAAVLALGGAAWYTRRRRLG